MAIVQEAGDAADDDSVLDSTSEIEGEVGVWSRSGVNAEAYKRRMVVQQLHVNFCKYTVYRLSLIHI